MSQSLHLEEPEFKAIRDWLHARSGIHLGPGKATLVAARLAKRVRALGMAGFGDYVRMVTAGTGEESLTALDLLTTNETYFFREPRHFEFLCDSVLPAHGGRVFRAWSAASSSGEEAYTLAMLLQEHRAGAWEVVGTDISSQVVAAARRGHYPDSRGRHIPDALRARYCRRGVAAQEGTFLVDARLRAGVQFLQANLNQPLPEIGSFDAILLRNVMIYFDPDTKRSVLARVLEKLRPGGHLFVGHSEALGRMATGLEPLAPSIYRKS